MPKYVVINDIRTVQYLTDDPKAEEAPFEVIKHPGGDIQPGDVLTVKGKVKHRPTGE